MYTTCHTALYLSCCLRLPSLRCMKRVAFFDRIKKNDIFIMSHFFGQFREIKSRRPGSDLLSRLATRQISRWRFYRLFTGATAFSSHLLNKFFLLCHLAPVYFLSVIKEALHYEVSLTFCSSTVAQNNQEYRLEYWTTRSSVRLHRSLIRLLAHFADSLAREKVNF